VLALAVRHRRVGSHEMNEKSSRSHSIFTGGHCLPAGRPACRPARLPAAYRSAQQTASLGCCRVEGTWLLLRCSLTASSNAWRTRAACTCHPSLPPSAVYIDCTPTRPDDHEYGITRYGKVGLALL
jgi:hypothetical protein